MLPTYKDCKRRINKEQFIEKQLKVDGYNVSIFNYVLLGVFNDCIKREMRGITFVFDKNKIYRYPSIHKFFNINNVKETQYNKLKNKKISKITPKLDGTMIQPILLPNDKIYMKTGLSFFKAPQNKQANNFIKNNRNYRDFIKECFNYNCIPIFELVGFQNEHIVKYEFDVILKLLKIRDLDTGEYKPLEYKNLSNKYNIYKVENLNCTLDELLKKQKVDKEKEGWVVEFDDNTLVKVKTKWYFDRHKIFFEYVSHPDVIFKYIVKDEIDDILSVFKNNSRKRDLINQYIYYINNYINEKEQFIKSLYEQFKDKTRKEIALYVHKNIKFPCAVNIVCYLVDKKTYDKKFVIDELKKYILKYKCNKYSNGIKFLNELKLKYKK